MSDEPAMRTADGRVITWDEYLATRCDVPIPVRNFSVTEAPRFAEELERTMQGRNQ